MAKSIARRRLISGLRKAARNLARYQTLGVRDANGRDRL